MLPIRRALLVTDAARAVIRAEMAGRGVVMAAQVAELQRQLVELGSGLEWLHGAGAFPRTERGEADPIRTVVGRMDVAPQQWAMGAIRYPTSFAQPTGAHARAAAFESLQRDAAGGLIGDAPRGLQYMEEEGPWQNAEMIANYQRVMDGESDGRLCNSDPDAEIEAAAWVRSRGAKKPAPARTMPVAALNCGARKIGLVTP